MIKAYLLILGGFIIVHTIYFRFIFTRLPFDIQNVSDRRAIIYLFLAIIFTIILLGIYYNFIRTYILKKPINENSRLFKIKKKIENFMEKYGPNAALKFFSIVLLERILPSLIVLGVLPFSPDRCMIWMMHLIRKNWLVTVFGNYYYDTTYVVFVAFPRVFVATMFVIDVCYYEHIELFFKWSLLLAIPLIFSATLGILKIYHDENIVDLDKLVHVETIEMNSIITYKDPEDEKIMSIKDFCENFYLDMKYFNHMYINFEFVKNEFNFITIYTMHSYLIGWIYIIYFYGPNFYNLFINFLHNV